MSFEKNKYMVKYLLIVGLTLLFFSGCQAQTINNKKTIYLGGDLSYTNEMLDCGGTFNANGKTIEPFQFFKEKGANIIRVRLWHQPKWTNYSTFEDVKRTIKQAKKQNLNILLDFHYSDTWADPDHQQIPDAWKNITDTKVLGDSVYQYTYQTLLKLDSENLLPEFVQVGNEINSEVMQYNEKANQTINWSRNVLLLNQGIQAVKDIASQLKKPIQTMLHVAQPENGLWWFEAAHIHGIANYDCIGLSYYPKWSKQNLSQLGKTISSLKQSYHKKVMIVETGYPYSPKNFDQASNVLDAEGKMEGYDFTPDGQRKFMIDLCKTLIDAEGDGLIYWEPTWVSTSCKTLWGTGSHWENATFFDASHHNEALPVFDFFKTK